MAAIAAHRFTTFLARLACLGSAELVGGPLLVCRAAAFGGDRSLTLVAHPCESSPAT